MLAPPTAAARTLDSSRSATTSSTDSSAVAMEKKIRKRCALRGRYGEIDRYWSRMRFTGRLPNGRGRPHVRTRTPTS
ncbi:Uncharacterised protein [Mycobacteroides abscessus]|nr:Uncharacterised protein [Mycobacteroides abscessus]